MNDMNEVIQPRVDQLTADHLLGGPRTIRITEVTIRPGAEQPVTINYEGDDGLPWRPCKSMSRILVRAWTADASTYKGRSVTLYRDEKVKWGGLEVGGIRVSHLSHIDREMVLALTEKKGSKKPFIVKPLVHEKPATQDRSAEVVAALVARVDAATTHEALQAITGDETVVKQRAWLASKRPEMAKRVDDAVSSRLADFDAADAAEEVPA